MQTNPLVTAVARYDLKHLSNDALLAGTRRLVGTSNQLFADLLAHLAEVEVRGIHRRRACASLYTYCIYELRFSEDAAFRRVGAARLVQRFPALFTAVAAGELQLTGLLMVGPHLTQANHLEILARAKHRTKRELAALIRQIDPLPDVPARIEPLGPTADTLPRSLRKPTWEQGVAALNPVRNLTPGERPRDWIDETLLHDWNDTAPTPHNDEPAPARCAPTPHNDEPAPARCASAPHNDEPAPAEAPARLSVCKAEAAEAAPRSAAATPSSSGSARVEAAATPSSSDSAPTEATATLSWPIKGPQRYAVQFTATEEYAHLVERAKALLSQTSEGGSIVELHLRAMRALVAQLEKRKYALTGNSAASAGRSAPPASASGVSLPADSVRDMHAEDCDSRSQAGLAEGDPRQRDDHLPDHELRQRDEQLPDHEPRQRGEQLPDQHPTQHGDHEPHQRGEQLPDHEPRQRGRYIPAAIRRAVYQRDEARCTYVDLNGRRCRETSGLELHHRQAFATGGQHSADNLTLHCHAHNALCAEQDFGHTAVQLKRVEQRHESLRLQQGP